MTSVNMTSVNTQSVDTESITIHESFENMGLKEDLLRGISAHGFEKPSAVQQRAITPVIEGKNSIIQAQSGSGKTATFGIAALQKVDPEIKTCQVLIVSPTRELATQTKHVISALGSYLKYAICSVIGGMHLSREEVGKAQIIIATPGRLYDIINRGYINMETVSLFVLDEADQMLGLGFREQMEELLKFVPPTSQIAVYSATMPPDMLDITKKFMTDPVKILVKKENLTLEGIKQFFIALDNEKDKYDTLCDLYASISLAQTVIYCSSKKKVSWLSDSLREEGYPISSIHGDIIQAERDTIMKEFRTGKTRVLITTDLLSRGIDIQQISLVINYDLPKEKESYIHRIGRTGRYGRKGAAINLVASQDDIRNIEDIQGYYNTQIEEMPANISELI